jgi:hypothetical protein
MMVSDQIIINKGRIFNLADTRIGFAQSVYSVSEPDAEEPNQDIILIREGGRLSEQNFGLIVNVGEPNFGIRSATVETLDQAGDYSAGGGSVFVVSFRATELSIRFPLTLFPDNFPEGLEAFRATLSPLEGFPHFGPPISGGAFVNTEVRIIDNDCKYMLINLVNIG